MLISLKEVPFWHLAKTDGDQIKKEAGSSVFGQYRPHKGADIWGGMPGPGGHP
jgi:hypothetical protein